MHPASAPCEGVANLKTDLADGRPRSQGMPYRLAMVLVAFALVASPAAAASLERENGAYVAAPDTYKVYLDGALARAEAAGAPVSNEDAPAAHVAGATVEAPTETVPSAVTASPREARRAVFVLLPDGFTAPATVGTTRVGAIEDSYRARVGGSGDEISLTDLLVADEGASSTDAVVATPAASTAGASTTPHVPSFVAPAAPAAGGSASDASAAVAPKPVPRGSPPTVQPNAVALAPVKDGGAAAAVAAGALAIGALLALWPLYHRLAGARTLESATRKRIYDVVCARPGAGVAEVAMKGGVSYSTATYHLDRLVQAGMLVETNEGGRVRWFKNGGFNEQDRKLVPIVENPEVMRILDIVRQNPGTYRAAIADTLNVTTTTVNWHLKRLLAEGLVREERRGRNAFLYADEQRLAALAPVQERVQSADA